jgi:hypothetical protein
LPDLGHIFRGSSFQDYLGKNEAGGIKAKNEWVHLTNWDCVVFDEYHYGAWRDNAKELFEAGPVVKKEKYENRRDHENYNQKYVIKFGDSFCSQ